MDPDQYRVYSNAVFGKLEGIGADLVLTTDRPQAKIQTGGPDGNRMLRLGCASDDRRDRAGGPADQSGLKPGDWAEFVDEHWIANSEAFDKLQALSEQVKVLARRPSVTPLQPQVTRSKRPTSTAQADSRRADKNILPIKARDRLMIGNDRVVKTQWVRGDQRIQAEVGKGQWILPGFALRSTARFDCRSSGVGGEA